MSTQGIESVLSRAMSDSSFADTLLANPAQALAGFDLTAEEIAKFQGMPRADFESLVTNPENRKSFGIIMDG
jgi:hypothetical protein